MYNPVSYLCVSCGLPVFIFLVFVGLGTSTMFSSILAAGCTSLYTQLFAGFHGVKNSLTTQSTGPIRITTNLYKYLLLVGNGASI
jgi:hypothetical protein